MILGWKDDAQKVLATAPVSADATARQLACELVHRLGGRGYFEFRTLLVVPYSRCERLAG